ncbi:YLR307C-A [Saccharomyces arboricola H-6]|uniref:YLR307C-A n=1 Tax=Saccharomyces arboricola (strain H-6 / AS 2.3317 / CBS 10644) TaxID=1160507 RepID=J8Q1Q4_SACAR|nr:YLR307C-A [Saccharomyces arboricola H-6]
MSLRNVSILTKNLRLTPKCFTPKSSPTSTTIPVIRDSSITQCRRLTTANGTVSLKGYSQVSKTVHDKPIVISTDNEEVETVSEHVKV